MLRLFDTAEGAVVPFEPAQPGKVSMYVCGPTVYGPPHLGHGRFALVFDVLRRYLEWTGAEVTYASNITDIDDKIIARAADEGRSAEAVATEYEQLWWEVMEAIGVARPTYDPHATAYVDEMIELIGRLVAQGVAYQTSDGVYFEASKVADYGLLARQSIDSLRAGARVEANEEKRSPVDFALWKKAKPGEPSWPSPWGDGRPGWHTECVVMSLGLLGDGFDLHGGGQDLAFPHHENERAQAVVLGNRFARHWMHNGFVEVAGEKMSKSLGNFTNLVDLIEQVDPRAYRLLVLRSHYRSPIDVTPVTTADAAAALQRLDALVRRAGGAGSGAGAADARRTGGSGPDPDAEVLDQFRSAMDDDLDTPAAMALLFDTVRRANTELDAGDGAGAAPLVGAVEEICRAVGLRLGGSAESVPPEVADQLARREAARAAKDFVTADAIRDQLARDGWVIEDGPTGATPRRA
ncbi:MAG TPA: cysteine--tRNA ligase [Acidimicrobiales bacterium]|jgi:cysteinyl-tRNA synthetase|nr:cysteine--tRNA ligase [Acidimicrobiales bacterium]